MEIICKWFMLKIIVIFLEWNFSIGIFLKFNEILINCWKKLNLFLKFLDYLNLSCFLYDGCIKY